MERSVRSSAADAADSSWSSGSAESFGRRIPDGRDFLSADELARLTPTEVARRTAALAPLIAEKAAEAERLRRPVPEVWAAIRASGFFYQFVPRAFGGLGTDTDTFVDAALPIARACPSTAWCACFCAGHNRTIGHFPERAQKELWGGRFPYVIAPMMGAPPGKAVPVEGGYRVTGAWSWASGVMDADWALATTLVADGSEGPPKMALALIPAQEVEVVDTWHVDGLCASGSNDARIEDVFVPEHRMMRDMGIIAGQSAEGRKHREPIFQAPWLSFAGFVASIPVLGAAQGALHYYRERLNQRVEKGTNAKSAESPLRQVRLAEAEVMLFTAETLIRDCGRQIIPAAQMDNPEQQVPLRVALRARTAYALRLCRDAVLLLNDGAGSGVHRLSEPFQRHVRDIGIMRSHVGFDTDQAFELHGRTLLGLEPNTILF